MDMFAVRPAGPLDAARRAMIQPLVEKGALVAAVNEAWGLVAVLTFAALLCVSFARGPRVQNDRAI
jgi:MFS transporter, DHA2 family, multidrug resistance protein